MKIMTHRNCSRFFTPSIILAQSLILLRFLSLASSSHLPSPDEFNHQDRSRLPIQNQDEEEHEARVSELPPDTRMSSSAPEVFKNHENFPFPKLKSAIAECNKDDIRIFVKFDAIFDGRVYAYDYADDKSCGVVARNNSQDSVNFTLPLQHCGVQMTTPLDEKLGVEYLRYDLVLYVQYSAFVQQAVDEKVAVSCMQARVPLDEIIDQNLEAIPTPDFPKRRSRQGRLLKGKSLNSPIPPKTGAQIGEAFMEIISGKDPSPKSKKIVPVFVGEDVTLVVSTKVMRGYDARIVNCSVNDGSRNINDGSRVQQILDSAGCSIDRGLVPNFRRRRLPIESRNRLITLHFASFPAFKFPERDHIHMKCVVAYCAGPCPQEVCDNGVNHFGSWKDKYGGRVADALVDTIEVANSLQVLAPNLDDNGGHQYERHQSSLAFGSATSAVGSSPSTSSTLSTVPSNLLDHPAYREKFSDTTKTHAPRAQYTHSAAMSALSSAATGRSLNNNLNVNSQPQNHNQNSFYYNDQQDDRSAPPSQSSYSGRVNQMQMQMMGAHHPNLTSVCISPGTLILVLVILGVVLVISASATLWLALRRSEAKKYARARAKHTTNTLSSYTTSSTGSPSPAPYYRFSHW